MSTSDASTCCGSPSPEESLRTAVRDRYGAIARGVLESEPVGCCGAPAGPRTDPVSRDLYDSGDSDELPAAAVAASLGCGNPTALAELREGEVVLDLGSGGGIDVLLSARRVGPTGKAYGIDMTDEMLALARRNQAEAGLDNVEFLKGQIEEIPLPEDHVDVVISNCVINLSADKDRVFREIHRVLKPGGRVAVSDIVVRGALDPEIRASFEAWVGCVAGALGEDEYRAGLDAAGFTDVEIEPTRTFCAEDAAGLVESTGLDPDAVAEAAGQVVSAFVRARKP